MKKDKNDVMGQTQNQNSEVADEPNVLPLVVQEEIGRRLRAVYGQMSQEPLPDKFTKLLQELANTDRPEKSK